ncbi:MAG: xanthine dehydrogenase molybdopterin binding subunit [Pseudomonadota bacterium]
MNQHPNVARMVQGVKHSAKQRQPDEKKNPSAAHESAALHVVGSARYLDDLPEFEGTVHAYLGLSTIAHGRIKSINLDAVRTAPGVLDVLVAADLDGHNDVSPTGAKDDPVFAEVEVMFHGQPVFAVVAETRAQARNAAQLAQVVYDELPHALTVDAARKAGMDLVWPGMKLKRGDAAKALHEATNRLDGRMTIGGQDHFYLEGHIAYAVPGEAGNMVVHSSTQHPTEVQHMVAHCLGRTMGDVRVEVRRMGGAFGGKETQSNLFAVVASLAATRLNRPVKIRPDRDDDMIATGKRHDFVADYAVAFDDDGVIEAVDGTFAARCGFSADLSGPVTDRSLFHADNCYFYPAVELRSEPRRTHTVSNTAFRGFGGPQGLIVAERIVEEIAYKLGRDPLDVRKANFYGTSDRNIAPYHQTITDNIIARVVDELEASCDYSARRAEIIKSNAKSPIIKRGIALTPVKFGISFTATFFNQAGALLHIYRDGSVVVNHAGTEMGQGLNTKVAGVVAQELGLPVRAIKVTATDTSKVPNTSATAASSGADLNGMAALLAARTIIDRLRDFAVATTGVRAEDFALENGNVLLGSKTIPFAQFVDQAYLARIQLSATGFYKTPEIHWDREKGTGRPFFYYAYGAACSEVAVDTLTGEYEVLRTDILHDVGNSLNPALDRGQVEGGFVQGMGWLTTEELWWDDQGKLHTHAPSTYKIPLASDVPREFNVKLVPWSQNPERTIRRSKAVGEPPFMLAVSVFEALGMATASLDDYRTCPKLDAPATPERVLMACEAMRDVAAAR